MVVAAERHATISNQPMHKKLLMQKPFI